MERLAYAVELKFAGEATGAFEGYASVFGVVDSHRDVVAPGAFKVSIAEMKARGFNAPLYLNHGPRRGAPGIPAGVLDSIEEDDKGLAVKGRLLGVETDIGRYHYELVKGGALRGISFSYRVPSGGATYGKTQNEPRRILKRIDLAEISLVDDPSNHMSTVTAMKAADELKTIREFEEALINGTLPALSAKEAKAFLAGGFNAIRSERDAGEVRAELAVHVRRNIATITP